MVKCYLHLANKIMTCGEDLQIYNDQVYLPFYMSTSICLVLSTYLVIIL
jgi:hypothetical protein